MSNINQEATSVAPIKKTREHQNFSFINRNSLTTVLVLGTFAAILTGKILNAPHDYESEQWMDESNYKSRF